METLLNLSDLYVVPSAREFVVDKLSSSDTKVSPARLLSMSIKYKIPDRFQHNFKKLVSLNLHTLEVRDLAAIPPILLSALLTIQNQVYGFRLYLLKIEVPQW